MWSQSFHWASAFSTDRPGPARPTNRSRKGLKSSYKTTNARASEWASLCRSNCRTICSLRAVLPLPFSPNTIEVLGSEGLPRILSQAG